MCKSVEIILFQSVLLKHCLSLSIYLFMYLNPCLESVRFNENSLLSNELFAGK